MIQLANSQTLHVTRVANSVFDLFRNKNSSQATPLLTQNLMHRPIPAPEPNPEPNPGPDGVTQSELISRDHILAEDWDELFHAVQARLEHCVGEALLRTPQIALHDRYALTKAAVLECVSDMNQLHASLTLERQKWQEHQRHQEYQELEKQQRSSGHLEH